MNVKFDGLDYIGNNEDLVTCTDHGISFILYILSGCSEINIGPSRKKNQSRYEFYTEDCNNIWH